MSTPWAFVAALGEGGAWAGTTVGFGDSDPGQFSRLEAWDPVLAGWGAAVSGDELSVPESGGVTEVDVPVAVHELDQHREYSGLVCGVEVAALGQFAADALQSAGALSTGRQVRAHRVGGKQRVQVGCQGVQPLPVRGSCSQGARHRRSRLSTSLTLRARSRLALRAMGAASRLRVPAS